MESNTPVTPQRNRRAGRITPLPAEQPLVVPPEQQSSSLPAPAAPQASAATPDPQQPAQPRPAQTAAVYPAYPQQPAQPRPAQTAAGYPSYPQQPAQSRPAQTAAGYTAYPQQPAQPRPAQTAAGYPAYPQQQPAQSRPAQPMPSGRPQARGSHGGSYAQSARPVAQSNARTADGRSIPPGARPQAQGSARPVNRDDPAARRAARTSPKPAPAAEKASARRSAIPAALWTAFSVLLVAVMALVAFSAWKTMELHLAEEARQKAWDAMLFNYHVTEQPDGTHTVTWQDTIEHYSGMYNLDPAFVTAIIRNESSFRADAESSAGARGLMQMMPDTAEWVAGKLGEPFDFDNLYDPETSIRYGCWYLGFLAEMFGGDPVLVCAAYHAGQTEVLNWLDDRSVSPDGVTVPIDNIPISNTRIYAGRVTQAYGIYQALLYQPLHATDVHGADHASDGFAATGR